MAKQRRSTRAKSAATLAKADRRWRSARTFTVVVERDEEGFLVASIPSLPGCHTQARSYAELDANIREAIELYLEVFPERAPESGGSEFVGVQRVVM